MFNKNFLKVILLIGLMTGFFAYVLIRGFSYSFSKKSIKNLECKDILSGHYYGSYVDCWNDMFKLKSFLFVIFIPFFYCCLSLLFAILEKKLFFIKNIFIFCIYYPIAYVIVGGYLIDIIKFLFSLHFSEYFSFSGIPSLFVYNLFLFTNKKYRTFAKVSFVYLNYFLLYPTIILGLINFSPSLFSLLYVNDFYGDKIFELASPYRNFIIISTFFTIFFQLYLWWGHDKLASFLKNKKVKKENLTIN